MAESGQTRLHSAPGSGGFTGFFTGAGIPVTVYGVATALARSPEQVAAMVSAEWEIASHGLKRVEHRDMPEAEEAAPG